MGLPLAFSRYREAIGTALRGSTGGDEGLLNRMVRYHMGWCDETGRPLEADGGKYLRPTLCLLSCEAVGGDWHTALPAAAGLEMIHAFSLVHDDIQDGDRERRHRPTVWSIWGVGQAINAGDGLAAMATMATLRVSKERAAVACSIAARACLTMIEGQCMDLMAEGQADFTKELYLEMIRRKTGAMIAGAMEMGAYLGSGREALGEEFGRAGLKVGLAFQIQDDLLGIWGISEQTGKPVGSDLRRRKRTLPLILGLERATGKERDLLEALWREGASEDGQVERAVRALESLGVETTCRELAASYCDDALVGLHSLSASSWAATQFEELLGFLKARDH